ncbi:MAG: SAM-dependent methyltransferase [Clostridia bacterium]|nr:SAM-dependent methyltransferase [Clostridia bacterium]
MAGAINRLKEIYSVIPACNIFADIGCDHGYIAKAMLDGNKCEKVIIADISAPCLKKAEDLLADKIKSGKAQSFIADGFDGLPAVDCALIAGMGGEEICAILIKAKSLPEKLVLQPMKNPRKVRETALSLGYRFIKDYTFTCNKKYYDVMVLEKGQDSLTEEELDFGRTNLTEKPQGFKAFIDYKVNELNGYLQAPNLNENSIAKIKKDIERLNKYV